MKARSRWMAEIMTMRQRHLDLDVAAVELAQPFRLVGRPAGSMPTRCSSHSWRPRPSPAGCRSAPDPAPRGSRMTSDSVRSGAFHHEMHQLAADHDIDAADRKQQRQMRGSSSHRVPRMKASIQRSMCRFSPRCAAGKIRAEAALANARGSRGCKSFPGILRPVINRNCVAARRGGEQREANDQSVG